MGNRVYKLKTRYGLSESVYLDILAGQGGKCKICGKTHTEEDKLHVDHYEGPYSCQGITLWSLQQEARHTNSTLLTIFR